MPTQKYVKMDQIDHIHHRPDTYIGSAKPQTETDEWVLDIVDGQITFEEKIVKRDKITYSPGLFRIFIEALSNAIDNVVRSKDSETPVTKIKISIDEETGRTSIWNDGLTIPVEVHEETGITNPELIFGHLLTSSNYDDNEERITSGRNGLGIKLTNIFSKNFTIKLVDTITSQSFEKTWKDGMRNSDKTKIRKASKAKGFTEVIWEPDFSRFGCENYSNDILSLIYRTVYDAAMLTKVPMYINGKKVPVKTLTDYAKLFNADVTKDIVSMSSENCEVVITPSSGSNFEHISFTNGVFNKEGGLHVDMWSEEIFRPLVNKFNKKDKPQISIKDVKQFFRVFVNCTIINPEFSSQSKTRLIGPKKIKVNVEQKHINSLSKFGVCDRVKEIIQGRELVTLKKSTTKTKSFKKIVGYDFANNAGTKKGKDCTLILCEGLSAKTYAVFGIDVGFNGKRGRDWYGIYPLRGKVLNVRNASLKSLTENKEVSDVVNALGLQYNVDYTDDANFKKLNYGKLMIMTDADNDGTHIKGLILNLIHHLFPSLLRRKESFVCDMLTPIVKISHGTYSRLFYSEDLFHDFMKSEESSKKNYKVKYYKGLGTSSDAEVKETFGKKVLDFTYDKFENVDENMNKIFSNKFADKRKDWLANFDETFRYPADEPNERLITDFIDHDLIKFSLDDCGRSIPNIFDGLKESQRKILYGAFLKNLSPNGKPIKVAQFSGFIAEKTNYHHGEQCLSSTITSMAQNFPGSNNVPFFTRDGQFGTRLHGGKDAASPRYIFTKLEKLTRYLFPAEDDQLLNYVIDDGDKVQPEYYLPIIPTILINGCTAGIGTGWSCSIPCFNPLDVITNVKIYINNKKNQETTEYIEMIPWYNSYTGEIKKVADHKFESFGKFEQSESNSKIKVSELPIGMWTEKFKEYIEDLIEEKKVKSMKNYSKPTQVSFEIDGDLKQFEHKLKSSISTSNMVLFTDNSKLVKFSTVFDIVDMFCDKRFELYVLRKKVMTEQLKEDLKYMQNKLRFLTEVMDDKLNINRKSEEVVNEMLTKELYDKKDGAYDYLLNMSLRSFTKQKVENIEKNCKDLTNELKELEKLSAYDLWENDIELFLENYN